MDANWRPTEGFDPAAVAASVDPNAAAPAGCEWRAQLQPEARSRIVNKIMETLKKHLPVSLPEGLNELQKIAVRFEEKIYTAATSQSDYLRKISLKMLSMEKDTAGSWECTSDSKSKQPRSSETTRCEFVERTEAALKELTFTCPVCLNKLEQPSATTCGHIFCEKCIKASIKAQKKCPTCRKNLGTRSYHRVYLPATADQGY